VEVAEEQDQARQTAFLQTLKKLTLARPEDAAGFEPEMNGGGPEEVTQDD
jgi:hypothetical protein